MYTASPQGKDYDLQNLMEGTLVSGRAEEITLYAQGNGKFPVSGGKPPYG